MIKTKHQNNAKGKPWSVSNMTTCEEIVHFRTEAEAAEFAAATDGVLSGPNGQHVSYVDGVPE